MLFGAYLVETVLWIVATIIVSIWATRIYAHGLLALGLGKVRKKPDAAASKKRGAPRVTILLPTYNEPRVVDRLLTAVTGMNYPSYEVIVADDSNDGVTMRSLEKWEAKGTVRVVHRSERAGFKAGALNNALNFANQESAYVLVLDADCVPQPDLLLRMTAGISRMNAAAVQGYAEQSLNSSQNILTRSMRVSSSSYCLVDVAARAKLNGFVPIFGSAFMIKKDLLDKVGGFDEVFHNRRLGPGEQLDRGRQQSLF